MQSLASFCIRTLKVCAARFESRARILIVLSVLPVLIAFALFAVRGFAPATNKESASGVITKGNNSASATRSALEEPAPTLTTNALIPSTEIGTATRARVSESYGQLPLSFEVNQGQFDARVKYQSRGTGYSLALAADEAVLVLQRASQPRVTAQEEKKRTGRNIPDSTSKGAASSSSVLHMKLAGGNPAAQVNGQEELAGKINYLIGDDPQQWRTDVPTFARVKFDSVYPDIDLVYYGNQHQLEYDFLVAPGGDARAIKLRFENTPQVKIDNAGNLIINVADGNVRLQRPFIYQLDALGEKQEVAGRYAITDRHEVGFKIADYDHARPLVIDPVLSYSTFLGGSGNDTAYGIAVDAAGNAYITGSTPSSNFPTAGTQLSLSDSSSGNAFVTKLNADGTALIYSTYLGGNSYDIANAIAVDAQGNAYLAGQTSSSNFPLVNPLKRKSNLYQTTTGGANWISKPSGIPATLRSFAFDPTTPTTLYAGTYNGLYKSLDSGNTWTRTGNVGIPSNQSLPNIYVDPTQPSIIYGGSQYQGMLKSTDRGDNWTPLNLGNNNTAGMVMAFAPSNPAIAYIACTNKICKSVDGGSSWSNAGTGLPASNAQAIAVDPTNPSIVYVGTYGGGVFKTIDGGASWSAINSGINSTYGNYVLTLAIDPLTPATLYAGVGYAATGGAIFKSVNGGSTWTAINNGVPSSYQINALLIDANSSSTLYAATSGGGVLKTTNAGGNWTPVNNGLWYPIVYALIASPSAPSTIFAGTANSTSESPSSSDDDAFLCKLNAAGNALVYSSYLGGSGNEYGYGIAVDAAGNAYITGLTGSNNFPTLNATQPTKGSDTATDAFLSKVNADGSAFLYSTYLGGSNNETGYAVAADATGNAYVTGQTNSLNFPVLNAFQSSINGTSNTVAFVTKFSEAGAFVYSTYLGGSTGTSQDVGRAIAVDSENCAYVTGQADSTNFPTLNPLQATKGGNYDAFVTKLSATGNALVYSTYLGGKDTDIGRGVAVDAGGNAYVTGVTTSTNFPIHNALQTRSGIFKSFDGAGSWSNNNTAEGLPDNSIQTLLLDPLKPSTLYAIVAHYGSPLGIYKSVNSGRNWNISTNGIPYLPIYALAIDPQTPSTLYAGTGTGSVGGNGIYKSTNGGDQWAAVNDNLPPQYRSIQSLAVSPSTPAIICAGTSNGIVRSTDGGATWSAANGAAITNVSSIAFDPLTPTNVYAASNASNGGVFKSVDGGVNWSAISNGLTTTYILRVIVDPLTPATLYATTSGALYKSTDGGNHWNVIPNISSSALFYGTLALDPQTPTTLYASTTGGLYKSANGGASWSPASNGMIYKNVTALAVHPFSPSIIYAGVYPDIINDSDVFVAKLNANGTSLAYSTYLGVSLPPTNGSSNFGDGGTAIALDASNNAYLTGIAGAPEFPTTVSAFRTANSGYGDAFISKLSMSYNIGGQILDANGAPLIGVRVVLSGAASQTITTDSDGTFLFVNLPQGATYTLTPLKAHYDFNPESFTVNTLGSDQTANFTANATSAAFYNINGHIVDDSNNSSLGGVTVTLSGSQNDAMTTDANGNYSFTVPAGGNYTVTPSYSTFTFNPPSGTFSNLSGDQVADFNGTRGVLLVTNTNDGGAGSMRQAILDANAIPGRDTINFQIASGAQTINLNAALPVITDPVILDATTQPGYAGAPLIELNGTNVGTSFNTVSGLVITGGNSVVRGFVINRFSGTGIVFSTNGGNTLQGNYIGLDLTGTLARGNHDAAATVSGSNNLIGGTTPAARNVIAASYFEGLILSGSNNQVQGNFIGTNAAGTATLSSGNRGLKIVNEQGSPSINNLIGGTVSGAGNLISGNGNGGIEVDSNYTTIQGNLIGTDVTGKLKIGNSSGIYINGHNNLVGGTVTGARNIISGNGAGVAVGSGATLNRIEGNFIGTDITGTALLGNSGAGVSITASNMVVGGTTPEARNIISGNLGSGVTLDSNSGGGVSVQGNYIGTDVTGTHSLPNNYGVIISSSNNTIGGVTTGARNLISGNNTGVQVGGFISSTLNGNLLQNNFIGTEAGGVNPLPNTLDGVYISNAANTVVGGTQDNAGNVIANNGGSGIYVYSGTGNALRRNSIYANTGLGIDLKGGTIGVTQNDAGDADTGANNLQNFPVITMVNTDGTSTLIQGSLNSTPSTNFNIDFYANTECDSSAYGEGVTYIGTTSVTTDANGNAVFSASFPLPISNQFITSTATDAAGNTSEFSSCFMSGATGRLQFSSSSYAVNENGGAATVTVNRTLGSTGTVTIDYATSNGTATAGADYAATSGTLTFANGETSKTFTIPILEDALNEASETFNINLSNPTGGAMLGTPSASIVTISDNDPFPSASINDITVNEGDAGLTNAAFTVTLSAASGRIVSFDYSTADGTATSGTDYQAVSGTLTFNAGETSKTITVPITGDTNGEADETFLVNLNNNVNANITRFQGLCTILNDDANPSNLVISEFRLRGPNGANDEFIELYNNTNLPVTVNTADGSSGWALVAADGITRAVIPNNTVIQGRAHYLIVNSGGYSLGSYPSGSETFATGDQSYSLDIPDTAGIALFRTADAANFTIPNRLDAAGFYSTSNLLYQEVTGLSYTGTTNSESSWVRKMSNGQARDTNNNSTDFVFVSTTGAYLGSTSSVLGAPGPENSSSPIWRENVVTPSYVDPLACGICAPNRTRVGSGNSGTLTVRRHFTNQTGANVTRLRFRVVDITTLGSPGGGVGSGQADLRIANSSDENVGTSLGSVTVQGTTIEQPSTLSTSGGINSSLTVALPNGGLAAGSSVDVQFLMNVNQIGRFRFFVSVEALP